MGRFQREHVTDLEVAQPLPEAAILAIEVISHHRAKRDRHVHGSAHQFQRDLELGTKRRSVFADRAK
jgi:hypothetical protein